MSIKEREEVQAKVICNTLNKIIAGNLSNLKEELSIQPQEASRTPNRLDQNRTSPWHIIVKTTSIENRERTMKAVRDREKITYKGKTIKITADFSTTTLKARRVWSDIF
jgi:hypothetical protein